MKAIDAAITLYHPEYLYHGIVYYRFYYYDRKMPEYQCCLCGIIKPNCTRKCFTCGSNKERRICDRCCAARNKCLECQDGESSNNQKKSNN